MKKIKGLLRGIGENMCGRMSFIEIHGSSELILSGCKKIIDYNTEEIICETLSGMLKITGSCLCLDVFRGDILTVTGKISGVYLNRSHDS